jgi:alpha-beta hydrolase superfamily lysophospholipase
MKTTGIAFIILGLSLPASVFSFPCEAANHYSTAADFGGRVPALDYSVENPVKYEPKNSSIRWYKRNKNAKLNGVALVIHGLNLRPDKMESVITQLTEAGIDCLNLSLSGHGENYNHLQNMTSADARMETFKSVTYPLWKTEAYQAYRLVKQKGKLNGAPLFFVGFSMGGLLGVDLLVSNRNVQFDKMVLFAPALKMHLRNSFLKILSPFPRIVIPSVAHKSYLTNDGTPMAAYNALFDMHAHADENLGQKINMPTIVFIDKKDELVSYSGLQNMIRDQNLDQWKIIPVQKDKTGAQVKMHHLIIDPASVGEQMWRKIVDLTITNLSSRQNK